MKEKTVYLILAGLFFIIGLLADSEFAIFEGILPLYIEKMAKIPCLYFFLTGITKRFRGISPIFDVILILVVILFADFGKHFLGESIAWKMILLFSISALFTYLLRIIVIYVYKEKK